ncbi:hypothetical protein R3W88_004489 [Solanum pinnatisectum]|uniref:Uncharacterized protein n=1 Tax=Solanum pinnatisectum TaxID=50273 RepID=A0AAV9K9F0_9SOLN|nr:hypothetical protein R3W88_004489 [Solanum pinnatisectum]
MVGIIDSKKPSGRAKPIQYLYAAKLACNTKVKDIKSVFPSIIDERNIPFICMDLVYEYTLLVDGFVLTFLLLPKIDRPASQTRDNNGA